MEKLLDKMIQKNPNSALSKMLKQRKPVIDSSDKKDAKPVSQSEDIVIEDNEFSYDVHNYTDIYGFVKTYNVRVLDPDMWIGNLRKYRSTTINEKYLTTDKPEGLL